MYKIEIWAKFIIREQLMILRRTHFCSIFKRLRCLNINQGLINNKSAVQFLQNKQSKRKCNFKQNIHYEYSILNNKKPPMAQNKITFQINKALTADQLFNLINQNHGSFNFIHRTVLLQKVTQSPLDHDDQLISCVVQLIKNNWKFDYAEPTQKNSRAIANTICYMSRRKKLHDLDNEFANIDYFQLGKYLNSKQFVMTLNGLLKLQLIDKIIQANPKFSLQSFLKLHIDDSYTPSLLVSMWFNILKFQKSTQNINDYFAQLLKSKNFKNNLIDYMQIVYCYVNSQGKRSVDLSYPILAYPKQINQKLYIGAPELSVLFEQLAKLKKIKQVYFSEQFNQLLQNFYLKIIGQPNIPLRNVANVFTYFIQYQSPTKKTLEATYHKYYTVIKNQIDLLQKYKNSKKFRHNVDSLSFVTLFNQLLELIKDDNTYLNQMTSIVLRYIQQIIHQGAFSQYSQRSFIRLLGGIQLAKNLIIQKTPGKVLQLSSDLKYGLERQIIRRKYSELPHLGKLIGFVYVFDIRSQQVCHKISKMIQAVPQQSQIYNSYQARFKQKCILHYNCKNCINCFNK